MNTLVQLLCHMTYRVRVRLLDLAEVRTAGRGVGLLAARCRSQFALIFSSEEKEETARSLNES